MVSLGSLLRPLARAVAQLPEVTPERVPAPAPTVDPSSGSPRVSSPSGRLDQRLIWADSMGRAISTGLTVSRRAAIALPILLGANLLDTPAQAQAGPRRTDYGTNETMSSLRAGAEAAFSVDHARRANPGLRAPAGTFQFNREAAARFFVGQSRGAIKEVPNPFPGSTLFEPTGQAKGAAILVLHGSEGGSQPYAMARAAELAKRGYAALAFSYFDVPGSDLPKKLLEVPLERTQQGADWLKARYGKVGLNGFSRGGEETLELASLDPAKERFYAVAGEVPASQIWGAWDHKKMRPILDARGTIRAAWTMAGSPLKEGKKIAIERYPGPIFLQGSGRDDVWPSATYVKELEARLAQHGRKAEIHIFPNESHELSEKAWKQENELLVDFFDRALAR